MTQAETRAVTTVPGAPPYVQWGPVIAGALAASALSFVLMTFGTALGLSLASPSPSWREASFALWALTGLFMILIALASFGSGGYIAGRTRSRWTVTAPDEVEFRDGTHGLLVWGLAVLISALITAATAASVLSSAAPAAGSPMTTTAEPLLSYEIDRLFRSERRPAEGDMTHARAEAGRILLASARDRKADDLSYLARLTAARTGLAPADAERRVNEVADRAQHAVSKARRSGVILGFMTAAALLLGAAAAWFAACLGGRHRDSETAPSLTWPLWPSRRATASMP
jgi:hypothetical protein